MGDTALRQSGGEWLRQYGRERARRQQGEEVSRLLAERLPEAFAAVADRPLSPAELEQVVAEMLACGERLVSGFGLPPVARMNAA